LIDISLLALTRAWFATVVALAVLLASFAIEQNWNSAVYWRGLPQAFELIGDEGPPIVDQLTETLVAITAPAARSAAPVAGVPAELPQEPAKFLP